ncbi:MAG: fibronectin type III domain-containing protein [Flavobacteriales bacterium]|nr:fibronectin type III domain-containing protein [Flavobacteriales bacterium]
MKANIKLMLSLLTPVGLLTLLRNVITKMTGNPLFPTPPVSMADMTVLGDTFQAEIEKALDGSRAAKLRRDEVARQVQATLQQTADYVRIQCLGNAAKLAESGFPLAKKREPVGVPGVSKNMMARITKRDNELELRWRSVHGAHGYQIWMTANDPNVAADWQPIGYTTRVSHLVTELESFKAYWFCVSAIGAAGEGRKCDPAMGRAA